MLDINEIRKDPERIQKALLKRMDDVDFSELLSRDEERRALIAESEELKARRNKVSADMPKLKKQGDDVQPLIEQMKTVSDTIKELDAKLQNTNDTIKSILDMLPNVPDDDVPAGGKENNRILREWGEKPVFPFEPAGHMELVNRLGLIDYERGVKLGGNGFWLYTGDGALLEWAMINFFIREHRDDGYEFILPPHILNYECGYTAGQFPKFGDDVYHIGGEKDESGQFLLPTAETALINMHRDEIIDEEALPLKYFSYTPCYRREAGSYRAQERGMIRGHQFNKVEVFQYTRPEDSESVFQELVEKIEVVIQKLGLHYRTSLLAARDASASMAKTIDPEVWIPSMNEYKEISSVSNARDFQARRGNIRFRRNETKRTEFIHSLNASGLATSRLIPAIVEQFQQEDGSVLVPEVLRQFVGKERLLPA